MTKQPVISTSKLIGGGYNRFWNNKNFYRVIKGSRGSKKSKNTALNFIYRIMKYPWSNLLVVRRYSNTNKQSTYTDLKWAANQMKVSRFFKFNESMPEITYLPTGQKILFRGLDDELKITSITVDVGILCWSWFEEAYQIETADKFRTVVESIRGSYDDPDFFKQITVTFNPWSERHWLKPMFFDANTMEKGTFSYTTTFRVNEWLDDVDKERYLDLYRTNPRRARIVCDGDWGIAEGLVFENFEVRDFNSEQIINQTQEVGNGLDFGYTQDPSAFISFTIDQKAKEIYIYDEMYEKGLSNQKIYSRLLNKGYEKSFIIADSAEPKSIDELRRLGLRRIKGAAKGKDSIMHGIQFIENYKIIIHPRCGHFIEEINNYVYDKDKEGNRINKPIDEFNHLMDAFRYGMEQFRLKPKVKTSDIRKQLGI